VVLVGASVGYVGRMISAHDDGVLVTVWVVPGAGRDEVVGIYGDALKVRTVAPAEDGKANRRVAVLVSSAIGGGSAAVVAGFASRRKGVVVRGVDLTAAKAALAAGLAEGERTG